MSDRERRLDAIRAIAYRLQRIADEFNNLRWMAEKETTSDAFLDLAEAAGRMTEDGLDRLANLLEIFRATRVKTDGR